MKTLGGAVATPTGTEADFLTQHSSVLRWLLGIAGTTIMGLAGIIVKQHGKDIEALQAVAHSPDSCIVAAQKADRSELTHSMERAFEQMRQDRAEVLGEIRKLSDKIDERPTRAELQGRL